MELHGAPHVWPATPHGGPPKGFLSPQVHLEAFWEKPQKVAFKKIIQKWYKIAVNDYKNIQDWYYNSMEQSKIIDTLETYQHPQA